MVRDGTQDDQEASYACQPGPGNLWAPCQTPRLHARRTDALLAGTVLRTVLTEENISWLVTEANDAPRASSVTRQDVKDLWENPERLVLAADSTQESRYFLGKIIAEIQIYTRTAIICYTLPLPGDSPLAGMRRQEVDLPEEVLA